AEMLIGKEILEFFFEHGSTARLEYQNGKPGLDIAFQAAQDTLQIDFGFVEHAEVVERTPAAKVLARNPHAPSHVFEYFHRGLRGMRVKIVVERVRPQNDLRSGRTVGFAPVKPLAECLRSEGWNLPLAWYLQHGFHQVTEAWSLAEEVGELRSNGRQGGPAVDVSKRKCRNGTLVLLIVMRHEFRFVRRNVNIYRTLALASLATQAEIERFLHALVLPPGFQFFALKHLKQHVRTTARRVLFFQRDHVTGTHHAFFFTSAFAYTDAAHGRMPEAAFILGKLEMSLRLPRGKVGAEAQVLVDGEWIDDFIRIHLVLRIPDRLELLECLHEFRPEHFGQHLGLGLSVSVLARNGTTVTDNQIGGLADEGAIVANSFHSTKIKVDARVDTAL